MDPFEKPPEPVASEAIRPEEPHWSLSPLYLAFRPRDFFRIYAKHSVPGLLALAAWFMGMAGVIDRIDLKTMTDVSNPLVLMTRESWSVYWGVVGLFGIFSGAMFFLLGGWWYRVRVSWSGAPEPDRDLARRVYLLASQVLAVPTVVYVVVATFQFATPHEAYASDSWFDVVMLLPIFWSIYVSYRGVRTVFDVRRWRARWWFFIAPTTLYTIVIGVAMAAGFAGILAQQPDVTHPSRVERDSFELEYPGNWSVDRNEAGYDPDSSFTIAPLFADAMIRFDFYDFTMVSQDCVDATLDNLQQSFETESLEPVESWAGLDGAGYRGTVHIDGGAYELLTFCSTEQETPFEILLISQRSTHAKIDPGFDHIERTFRILAPRLRFEPVSGDDPPIESQSG